MASFKSNYLDNKILNWILNAAAYTPPATLYIALFTVRPAADGTGGTEVTIGGNNYARAVVTANTTNFPTATAQTCPNGAAIVFNTPSGGGWGTITSFAIMDAATGGNYLYIGDLTTNFAAGGGVPVQFVARALVVGEQ